jgi:hypothetical protein
MKLRLSPSGPVIGDAGGGFRLRLTDVQSAMSGSLAVPTASSVVCSDGFGGSVPIILQLALPKPEHKYRANFRLDLVNTTTNSSGEVVLYLETSVDGTNWTVRSKNGHLVNPSTNDNAARQAELALPLTLGEALGIVDGTAILYVRASARCTVGDAGQVHASVPATSGGVSGLDGTLYYELEEVLAA